MSRTTVKLIYIGESHAAYKVENANGREVWLPKSEAKVMSRDFEDMEEVLELEVPQWLADEKELE